MASGKSDKAELAFLDRNIADMLQNNDFKGVAQLKTALKRFVKDQLVDDNSDHICDAWADYRVNQKSGAMKTLPTPPPSIPGLPAKYSPAAEDSLEIDLDNDGGDGGDDDDGNNFGEEESVVREGRASVDQVSSLFPFSTCGNHLPRAYIPLRRPAA